MSCNETKNKIFLTAIDLFTNGGYAETTMRELASRVGIRPASLYYYYASKDEILNEIFEFFLENDSKYRTPIKTILRSAEQNKIAEVLKMMFMEYKSGQEFGIMIKILNIAFCCQLENPRAREVFNYIFYEKALVFRIQTFKELIDRGLFPGFDYHAVAHMMTAYSLARFIEHTNNPASLVKPTSQYSDKIEVVINILMEHIEKHNTSKC